MKKLYNQIEDFAGYNDLLEDIHDVVLSNNWEPQARLSTSFKHPTRIVAQFQKFALGIVSTESGDYLKAIYRSKPDRENKKLIDKFFYLFT